MKSCALLVALLLVKGCGVPAPPDVPALERRAGDGDAGAARALVELLSGAQSPELRQASYKALLSLGAKHGAAILKGARDSDPVLREHALALAGNLRLPGAYDEAVRALEDPSFPRRYVAAWALGQLGDARGAAPLIRAIAQEGGELRREAARALIKVGPPAAAPLLTALPTLSGEAKASAIRVLGEVRDAAALAPLIAALADPAVRADAVWALGTMSRPEAAKALLPLLHDPDWRVRVETCRSLGLLSSKDAEPGLERLRGADPVSAVREWAARSLALLRGTPQEYVDARGETREPDNLYR